MVPYGVQSAPYGTMVEQMASEIQGLRQQWRMFHVHTNMQQKELQEMKMKYELLEKTNAKLQEKVGNLNVVERELRKARIQSRTDQGNLAKAKVELNDLSNLRARNFRLQEDLTKSNHNFSCQLKEMYKHFNEAIQPMAYKMARQMLPVVITQAEKDIEQHTRALKQDQHAVWEFRDQCQKVVTVRKKWVQGKILRWKRRFEQEKYFALWREVHNTSKRMQNLETSETTRRGLENKMLTKELQRLTAKESEKEEDSKRLENDMDSLREQIVLVQGTCTGAHERIIELQERVEKLTRCCKDGDAFITVKNAQIESLKRDKKTMVRHTITVGVCEELFCKMKDLFPFLKGNLYHDVINLEKRVRQDMMAPLLRTFDGALGSAVMVPEGWEAPKSMEEVVKLTAHIVERIAQINSVMSDFIGGGVETCLMQAWGTAAESIYTGTYCFKCHEMTEQCACRDEGEFKHCIEVAKVPLSYGITREDRNTTLEALKDIHSKELRPEQVLGAQRLELGLLLEAKSREEYIQRDNLLERARCLIFLHERDLMANTLDERCPRIDHDYTGLRMVFTDPMKAFLGGDESGMLLCVGVNSDGHPTGHAFTMSEELPSMAEAPFDIDPALVKPLLDYIGGLPSCTQCDSHIPPGQGGVECSVCGCMVHQSCTDGSEEKDQGWVCGECVAKRMSMSSK